MGLELLTEGRWEDLESAFLDHLLEDMPGTPFEERWVLTPHSHLIQHLQRHIAPTVGACSGLRFMDFPQLARRVITCSGAGCVADLGRVARDLLVRKVVREHLPGIEHSFGVPASLTPALVGAITKTLSDLREAGISGSAVAGLVGKRGGLSRARLQAVSDLYASYLERLASVDALDREGLFRNAAELLARGVIRPPRWVYVYGFYDLTGGQAALLDALFETASIRQYVPVYPETDVYAGVLLRSWRNSAEEKYSPDEISSIPAAHCPLNELWQRLSTPAGDEVSTITVASAPGKGREVDTALRIAAGAWSGGIGCEDTRLVAVSPDSYSAILSHKLESNGFQAPGSDGSRVVSFLLSEIDTLGEEEGEQAAWAEWSETLNSLSLAGLGPSYIDSIERVTASVRELAVTGEPAGRDTVKWALSRIAREITNGDALPLHGMMDLRGTRSELVIVLGMAEGSWPSKPTQDPLLPDEERETLAGGDAWLLPTSRRRASEDRLLFRLLRQCGKRIVFLYPRLDEQGSIRRASPHLLELMQDIEGGELSGDGLEALARRHTRVLGAVGPQPGEPPLGELDRDLEAAGRAIAGEESHDLDAMWGCSTFRAGWRAEMERWKGEPGPYSGFLISGDCIEKAMEIIGLGGEGHISVSLLEEYAGCPWRVMVERILGLPREEEEEELDGRLSPAEMGQALHDLFRDFVGLAADQGQWPPSGSQAEANVARLRTMVAARISKAYSDRDVPYPALERVDSRSAFERLLGWLSWESAPLEDHAAGDRLAAGAAAGWTTHSVEREFSAELELAGRKFRLKGRWDRVDRDDSGNFRIVDYKTGRSRPGQPENLEGGLGLQMPLYLLAADRAFGSEGTVAGGVFLQLKPDRPGSEPAVTVWPAELMEKVTAELGLMLDALLRSLESGVFVRLPHDNRRYKQTGLCSTCPSPTICRAWRLEESQRHLRSERLHSLNTARKIQ